MLCFEGFSGDWDAKKDFSALSARRTDSFLIRTTDSIGRAEKLVDEIAFVNSEQSIPQRHTRRRPALPGQLNENPALLRAYFHTQRYPVPNYERCGASTRGCID